MSLGFLGLLGGFRFRVLWGGACLVLLALSNGGYAYLTGPVVQVVLTGGKKGVPYLLPLVDWSPALARSASDPLVLVAVLLVGLALLKGISNLGQSLLLEGTAERIAFQLRLRLYNHLMRWPLSAHRQQGLGEILTHLLDDIQRVQEAAVRAPMIIVREVLGAIALLGIAIWMSPRLAFVAAIALPVAALVIGVLSRGVKNAAGRRQEQIGALVDRAAQGLGAIREVKSCSSEDQEVEQFAEHGERARRWAIRRIFFRATGPLINEVMASVALALTLIYAGGRISIGLLPPERFISFFAAVLLMYRPIKQIGQATHLAAAGRASIDRIGALLDQPIEEEQSGPSLAGLKRSLVLQGVCFSYQEQSKQAIESIDLEIPVGKIIALAGPSGSGKTTIANLVCGLDRPNKGKLLWDGMALDGISLRHHRAQVALVPQQPLLLDRSVAENLRYGAPQATLDELRQVIEGVGLRAVVDRLEEGLKTVIGPSGVGLSVGEAQRLALARALLRPVKLLVLDEPSSALDAGSEARLIETLKQQRQKRAILLIAHRSSLLQIADRVIRLEKGRIV